MLYLASQTVEDIERLKQNLPHASVFVSPVGVGLYAIATSIAGNGLSGVINPTDVKGEIDMTSSGVIRVTQIRELGSHAMSKTRTERIYIIDNADQMNHQTQNAFLKLLEEPVDHVHFILLTHHVERLLPTVRSRVQQLSISPIDHVQSLALLDELKVSDATVRSQLLFLADGLPAELTRLVEDTSGFQEKASAVTAARQFLQGSTLDKLRVISEYSASRPRTLTMLAYAERILSHSLRQNPSTALIERSNHIAEAYDRIAANGHIKTQLMGLVV